MLLARQPSSRLHRSRALHALLMCITIALLVAVSGVGAAPTVDARGLQPPEVTAKAVYAFDMTSGIELYTKNPDERLQIGSIVKIATALVVMENASLDEQVVIQESDLVDTDVYSHMGLHAGDTLTVSQLLYGLLLPSGGDAALALARHVGGKLSGSTDANTATDAFVRAMNDYAMQLGLKNTHFTVPDGRDTPNSYSSAHDVAILGAQLMKNEFLASIVKEPGYRLTSVGAEARVYESGNTNIRLGQNGIVGIKTGSTEWANVVLARQVNNGNNMVIMAIIGADPTVNPATNEDARWADADALIAAMDQTFSWIAPDNGDLMPGLAEQMQVWDVQFQNPPAIPVPTGGEMTLGYQLQIGPAADPGQQVGALHLYYGESEVGAIPIYQAGEQASWAHPQRRAAA